MKRVSGFNSQPLAPITLRPMQRADFAPLELLRKGARRTEIPPEEAGRDLCCGLALEIGQRLVGEARGLRILKEKGETLAEVFGGGSWVQVDLPLTEETLMKLITATSHDVLRRLGLPQIMSLVPLERYEALEKFYALEAYVQQVAAGAVEEPLLRAHLRLGARIVAVHEVPLPLVQVCWKNPIR